MAGDELVDRRGGGTAVGEDGGGAGEEREDEGVAEAVGEVQPGDGERDVVRGDAEQSAADEVVVRLGVAVDVHDALGAAGRSRGVLDVQGAVGVDRVGVRGGGRRGAQGDQLVGPEAPGRGRGTAAGRAWPVAEFLASLAGRRDVAVQPRSRHPQDRLRVLRHELEFGWGEFGVDQDRHRAQAGEGEEGGDPGDGVREGEQDAVAGADAVVGEDGGGAGREVVDLAVGVGPVALVEGRPVGPAAPLDEGREMGREVARGAGCRRGAGWAGMSS